MEFERKKCRHKIYRSKYERNAPEIANWWYELFREMESEAAIVSISSLISLILVKDCSLQIDATNSSTISFLKRFLIKLHLF